MSAYWKGNILTNYRMVWSGKEDSRFPCGVMMDPQEFIPLYLKRFLGRLDLEGKLPPSGSYVIEFKVHFVYSG